VARRNPGRAWGLAGGRATRRVARAAGWAGVALLGLFPGPAAADGGEPVQAVTVAMTEYRFEPATLTLAAGVEVRLTLENRGTVMHEFATPYLAEVEVKVETGGVNVEAVGLGEVEVPPGGRAVLVFTPEETGTFLFVCGANKPVSHLREGMRGTLVVH
jgi:uncharacterized cupredoxin-like copper-binding protein